MRDDLHTLHDPGVCPFGQRDSDARQSVACLRVLATTDIHMQLLGYDYILDRPAQHHGLAGLATLIREARAEAKAQAMPSILIDNGDLLQGSVLGQQLARLPVTPSHPVVACLNDLQYDGLGLGNHDLDHGVAYLADIAKHLSAPVVSSNLAFPSEFPTVRHALIRCRLPDASDPTPSVLHIGLVSALPELTAVWNEHQLRGNASVLSARRRVSAETRRLRQQGADLVILLAHMGLEGRPAEKRYTDDARARATIHGIDAIISGHTHRRLPGQDHEGYAHVDTDKGALASRPAAMPGFEASDLAVLDLKLGWSEGLGWRVLDHQACLRPNLPDTPPDPRIVARCKPAHDALRSDLARACGHSDLPIHNFFSLATPTATCALVSCAKYRVIARGIADLPERDLPILATASAHTAGGRGGPAHFLHIPPGTVYRRHLAGLSPYGNAIWALRVNGDDLRRWLEHTAGVFHQLTPESPDQPLLRQDRPAFDFDTIFGLDYAIDPTRPAGTRLVRFMYKGRPVTPDQSFVLATNQFRAAGGGGGHQFDESQIILRSETSVSSALIDLLKEGDYAYDLAGRPWQFATPYPVSAVIRSAPESRKYLRDIVHLSPIYQGTDPEGFARIRLSL